MVEPDIAKLHIDKRNVASRQRKKRRYFSGVLLLALFFIGLLLYHRGVLTPSMGVQVVAVQNLFPSQTFTLLNASGYVVAQRKSAVASKTTGRIVSLKVEEGSRVKKDEVIARLEHEDALAAQNRAQANVTLARAKLEQAKAELEDALLSHNRNRALVSKGYIAESVFDTSEARYRMARAEVAAQEAAVKASLAGLEEMNVLLGYTYIRAPFDGVVLTKNADIGDIVTPLGAAANAKAAVVTIADMGSLQVEVDVSESNIGRVKVGQPCEIRLDALPDLRFSGMVHMIVPTADRSKASVMVKVAFKERSPQILPEMSAKVAFLSRDILPEEKNPLKAIPGSAVISRNGETFSFVIRGDRAAETPLQIGRRMDNVVEVLRGLEVGDKVIMEPLNRIRNGHKIRIVEK